MLNTYYAALVAIIGRYFIESFGDPLPWATCRAEWGSLCINSAPDASNWSLVESDQRTQNNTMKSQNDRVITSSEWYFV